MNLDVQTPQKLAEMLTARGSGMNGICFSGFSTLRVHRAVAIAERAGDVEPADLDSGSAALLLAEGP